MDESDLTMEVYIKLHAEKAQRHDFEADFPAIVYKDALTSNQNVSSEPTVNEIIESVVSCETAKATWTDLVHSFEGPSDTKENRIMDLKLEYQTFRAKPSESLSQTYTQYKTLLNELTNDGVNLSKHEINISMEDFLENFDDESSQSSSSQADPRIQKDYKAEYKKMKAKLTLLKASPSTSQTPKTFQPKNKGLVAETFNWDEEECRDELFILKQAKLDAVTFQIQNTKLTKLNHVLQEQLKEEKKINEKWLTSSKKVSQCISEQIPYQKKKVLGELLTESSPKLNENENHFIPASMGYDHEMIPKSKDWVE
ncbi:hypothetical protein Tco_1216817 [Tanacetum coccineum]